MQKSCRKQLCECGLRDAAVTVSRRRPSKRVRFPRALLESYGTQCMFGCECQTGEIFVGHVIAPNEERRPSNTFWDEVSSLQSPRGT